MGRRRKGELKKWEAKKPNDSYCRISRSMRNSYAFGLLTGNQIRLYLFAIYRSFLAESASENQLAANPKNYPLATWRMDDIISSSDFFLNWAIVERRNDNPNGLYNKNNKKSFYSDRKKLVELGFLDEVINASKSYSHFTKSVYRMSDRWQSYN